MNIDTVELTAMWLAGVRSRDIAAHFGSTTSRIADVAERLGLPRRGAGWKAQLTIDDWLRLHSLTEAEKIEAAQDAGAEAILGRLMLRHAHAERAAWAARWEAWNRAEVPPPPPRGRPERKLGKAGSGG